MRSLRPLVFLSSLLAVVPAPTTAQVFKNLAFGDSITEGFNDHPNCLGCANPLLCGYPQRLSTHLGCNGSNCLVVNHGQSFEQTLGAITRLNGILTGDPDWDLLVLMEGSNDLFTNPAIPEETIRDNLKQMAHDAAERGIDTLHASIIRFHYLGNWGQSRDGLVDNLGTLTQTLASNENRYFADQRAEFCGTLSGAAYRNCQNAGTTYCEDAPNKADKWVIGHPGPQGFDQMAQEFADEIKKVPVPGVPVSTGPANGASDSTPILTWTKESPDDANWYQVQLEDDTGGDLLDQWFPEANISAIGADPLIPGVCSGNSCSVSISGPLAAGDYAWRVRGRNPRGRSTFTADFAFTVYTAPPDAVSVTTAPSGNSCVATPFSPSYVWSEVADATDYRLTVDGVGGTVIDQTFAASAICAGGVCTASASALTSGSYTWQVQSQNPAGNAAFSSSLAFDLTQSPLAMPVGDYPTGDLVITTPTYRWLEASGATSYTLGGTIPATDAAGFACSGGVCSVKPGAPLLDVAAYTWTVTPSNTCGSGAASSAVAFSVVMCSTPGDLTLQNGSVAGTETQDACGTIQAGNLGAGDYSVDGPNGDLTLHSGTAVELYNGFSVGSGASLTVVVDQ